MSRATADQLSLIAHCSLDALRIGVDEIGPAHNVSESIPLCSFLSDEAGCELSLDILSAANRAMSEVYDGGRKTAKWIVTSKAVYALLAQIVCRYDRLVQNATLGAFERATHRFGRIPARYARENCTEASRMKAKAPATRSCGGFCHQLLLRCASEALRSNTRLPPFRQRVRDAHA
ncbi:hypothetical protein BHUM_05431 [Candidatus Burkholderia humilis]|nr:hypothetical protein BHUM_05431 [Candidatus Burkholderia humilis]